MRTNKRQQQNLSRLIELKLQLEVAKTLYAQYDELLQIVLNTGNLPAQVSYKGMKWHLELVDAFGQKNTAWKSVAHRRFDISIKKQKEFRRAKLF